MTGFYAYACINVLRCRYDCWMKVEKILLNEQSTNTWIFHAAQRSLIGIVRQHQRGLRTLCTCSDSWHFSLRTRSGVVDQIPISPQELSALWHPSTVSHELKLKSNNISSSAEHVSRVVDPIHSRVNKSTPDDLSGEKHNFQVHRANSAHMTSLTALFPKKTSLYLVLSVRYRHRASIALSCRRRVVCANLHT